MDCYSNLFYLLLVSKIRWENRLNADNGSICKVSVDGTDFRIYNRPTFAENKRYFSHKFKGPGLRYEVSLSIQRGDIVRIFGPFPCGDYPDINIFRMGLKKMLTFGKERVEADEGYRDYEYVDGPQEHGGGGAAQIKLKSRVRGRHETVNRRFKQWGILRQQYRHHLRKHGDIFNSIATITQLDIKSGNILYQVSGYKTMQSSLRSHNIDTMLKLKKR